MSRIGEELRKLRNKKALSYEEISRKTKIHPRILQAIEEERFDYFSSALYAKSFLKKYAEFLGLKRSQLLEDYNNKIEEIFGEKKVEPVIASPRWLPFKEKFLFALKICSASALAIFMIFFLFWITGKIGSNIGKKREKPAKVTKVGSLKKEKLLPAVSISTPINLEIKANGDSWMELKADGKVIFEGILRKGSSESWKAEREFELWVGKADVLEIIINGNSYGSLGEGIIKGIKINKSGIKLP